MRSGNAPRLLSLRSVYAAALAIALGMSGGHSASGQTPPRTRPISDAVTVEGDGSCLDSRTLSAGVARWLKLDAIDSRVSIVVTAQSSPNPTLSFVVIREGSTIALRKFEPPPATCDDIRAAVSIAIALAVQATVLKQEIPATPPPEPTPPPPAPAPKPPFEPSVTRVDVSLGAVLLANVLPKLTLGLRTRISIAANRSLAFDAAFTGTSERSASVGPGSANTRLVAGEVAACWIASREPVGIRFCGGAAGGGVLATGDGFSPSASAFLPWVALQSRAALRVPISRAIGVNFGVDGFVPLVRPRLDVAASAAGTVLFSRSLPPIGAGAEIGVFVSF